MKRLFFLFFGLTFFVPFAGAVQLIAQPFAEVVHGITTETTILSDVDGTLFLVVPQQTYLIDDLTITPKDAKILPPQMIEKPRHHPVRNLKHLHSFELFLDDFSTVGFADKFYFRESQEIARNMAVIKSTENIRTRTTFTEAELMRSPGVRVLISFATPVGKPILWQYVPEFDEWYRIGGTSYVESETGNIIFSAYLKSTGTFTIFDESPFPEPVNPDEIFVTDYATGYKYPQIELQQNQPIPQAIVAEIQNTNFDPSPTQPINTSPDNAANNPLLVTPTDTTMVEDEPLIQDNTQVVIPAIADDFPTTGTQQPIVSADNPLIQPQTPTNTTATRPRPRPRPQPQATPTTADTTGQNQEPQTNTPTGRLNPLSASLFDAAPTAVTDLTLPESGDETSSGMSFLWIFSGALTLLIISFFLARRKKY